MGEGGLHVAEAAYFDILIGESECGNPRGGVCNLTLLFHPVRLCRPPSPPFQPSPVLARFHPFLPLSPPCRLWLDFASRRVSFALLAPLTSR